MQTTTLEQLHEELGDAYAVDLNDTLYFIGYDDEGPFVADNHGDDYVSLAKVDSDIEVLEYGFFFYVNARPVTLKPLVLLSKTYWLTPKIYHTKAMKVDYKITTWERFDIDDEHKDALMAFLKENPKATAMDIFDWSSELGVDPYVERIEGSDEEMTPKENDGYSTLEISTDDFKEVLFSNQIVVDNPNS